MGKEKKCPPSGAPEWMVTFGDMMSLLLCFFVIIVSLSEIKEVRKYQDVMEEIMRNFGMDSSIVVAEGESPPTNTWKNQFIDIITPMLLKQKGKNDEKGIKGIEQSVTKIRDGLEYTLGGMVSFDKGSAELLDNAKAVLVSFIETVKGYELKLRIRAHTTTKQPERYKGFSSLDELSYMRGKAIKLYFIEMGIKAHRIAVEVVGDNEPIENAYYENQHAKNRRVSIVVLEELVSEPEQDEQTSEAIKNG